MIVSYAYILDFAHITSKEKQLNKIWEFRKTIKESNIYIDNSYSKTNYNKLKDAIKVAHSIINEVNKDATLEVIFYDLSVLTCEELLFFNEHKITVRILSIPSTLENDITSLFTELFIELSKNKYVNTSGEKSIKRANKVKMKILDTDKFKKRYEQYKIGDITVSQIAREFSVSEQTVYRRFAKFRDKERPAEVEYAFETDEGLTNALYMKEYDRNGGILYDATLVKRNGKYVVVRGAILNKINPNLSAKIQSRIRGLRCTTRMDGYETLEDTEFDTPSKAGMFVRGTTCTASRDWKTASQMESKNKIGKHKRVKKNELINLDGFI